MKDVRISEDSEDVSLISGQTTGVFEEVFNLDPSDNIFYLVDDGFILKLQMVQSGGTELLPGTEIRLGIKKDGEPGPKYIAKFHYRPHYFINQDDGFGAQFIENRQGSLDVELDVKPGISVKEGEKLIMEIKAGNAIDWTNSACHINFEARKGNGKPPR